MPVPSPNNWGQDVIHHTLPSPVQRSCGTFSPYARLASSNWQDHLPWDILSLRVVAREDSGISATELVYGSPLMLPSHLLTISKPPPPPYCSHSGRCFPVCQTRQVVPCRRHRPPVHFSQQPLCVYTCERRQSRRFSHRATAVPTTCGSPSNKYYVTDIGGRPQAFSIGNIKPHLEASPFFPVNAPRRGHLSSPGGT
jgi:hypothetical protein